MFWHTCVLLAPPAEARVIYAEHVSAAIDHVLAAR